MIYLNQLDYPDMPYTTDLDNGGAPAEKCNVAAAGCGPCSLCMVVEGLTMAHLDLTECLRLSHEAGADRRLGTSLAILGPVIAEKYGLSYRNTSDPGEMAEHLRRGGLVIANSGGDREGYTGVFTHGGHYVTVLSVSDGICCILDPSWKPGKYDEEGRKGLVREAYPYMYCSLETLAKDCENRDPAYHLFARQSDPVR